MAFGFTREAGSARGYINSSNAEFAPGERLSRQQYDKYVEKLGKRIHQPSVAELRETERQLEDLRQQLQRGAAGLDAREESLRLRELELQYERASFRRERTDAGQRRFNAALESYVRNQRARGKRITKVEARRSPEFKAIMRDLKGKPNRKRNPVIADQNRFIRRKALDKLGGDTFFRDQYESLYGGRGGGHGFRVNIKGRSIIPRRRVA